MKKILTFALAVSMMASLAASSSALEYSIDAPDDYDFGKDTSIEVIHTADGGAMKNADMSKNAALIPPVFQHVNKRNERRCPFNGIIQKVGLFRQGIALFFPCLWKTRKIQRCAAYPLPWR